MPSMSWYFSHQIIQSSLHLTHQIIGQGVRMAALDPGGVVRIWNEGAALSERCHYSQVGEIWTKYGHRV